MLIFLLIVYLFIFSAIIFYFLNKTIKKAKKDMPSIESSSPQSSSSSTTKTTASAISNMDEKISKKLNEINSFYLSWYWISKKKKGKLQWSIIFCLLIIFAACFITINIWKKFAENNIDDIAYTLGFFY